MSAPTVPSDLPRENVFGHAKKARLVLAALDRLRRELGRGLEVLDVGCGNGAALTRFLAKPGDRVLGIDTHGPSIEYAARHYGAAGLEFRRQAAESLLAEGRSFDAVLVADILEHLPKPGPVLEAGVRLLRPRGRILVTVPNGRGPFEIESWLSRLPLLGGASLWALDHLVAVLNRYVFPGAWTEVVAPADLPYNEDSGHVQFYSRARLLLLARTAGLDPVREAGLSWLSGPYTNYLFAPSRLFCRLNTRAADFLPRWMLSAWFFEFAHATKASALVLSPTPPAPELGRMLQARLGADAVFADLPGLRRSGLRASFARLRGARVRTVVLAGQRQELALFRDYLVVLAACVPAASRQVLMPGQEPVPFGLAHVVRSLLRIVAGLGAGAFTLARAWFRVRSLRGDRLARQVLSASGRCLYLKPTLTFGANVGGSVAHVAGVVNALLRAGVGVRLLAAHEQPLLDTAAEQMVAPPHFLVSFPYELNQYRYQAGFLREAETHFRSFRPDFIYERYCLNDITGVILRRRHRVPLVLEFNGSEVWVQRHWGQPLRFEALASAIERINLQQADLVVVVSQALVEQAVSLGVAPERVLFYPNGIDPAVFDPARFGGKDRRRVREGLGIPPDAQLLTFVGTFGQWHGTDVLAAAIRKLIDDDRTWLEQQRAHFLLVGDGALAPKVRSTLGPALGTPFVTLAGLRPQGETPGILAASDILLSPHVPNPDGTPFFGSPTKLFEYMAMARLIVASDLDQIGWVLKGWRPGTPPPAGEAMSRAALLVEPGSLDSLVQGIRRAVEMPVPEREVLASTARRLALESFTWDKNAAAVLARAGTVPCATPRPIPPVTDKRQVRDFWEQAPCGEAYAQGESLPQRLEAQARTRYQLEPYLPAFARFAEGRGLDVLEVGVGMGADHLEWARSAPCSLTGIDFTPSAVAYTSHRLALHGLRSRLLVADAERLPFPDHSFDLVYSWGVIHHSPDTPAAAREIQRVLRPRGRARVMIYHRRSLVGYMLWLRYGLLAGRPGLALADVYARHLESPGTRAYSPEEARKLFVGFSEVRVRPQLGPGDLLLGAVGQRHRGILLEAAKALYPRWAVSRLFPDRGLYLLIEATK